MPGVRSLEKQQYYAHPQNQFWKMLFSLFDAGAVPEDYEKRKQLLLDQDIALWDVLESCEREGSLDSRIRNAVANDIPELIREHPSIETIFFNGRKSHQLYQKRFGNSIGLTEIILPSTSPALTLPFEKKQQAWSVLLNHLDR